MELWDETKMNSQPRVQDDTNHNNQEKKAISANQMEVLQRI
jgi:hypothetical protein